MAAAREEIVGLEKKFWQSMVDKDPETAMTMIADESLVTGPMGTMKIDPAKYGEMTREGNWTLDSFTFKDVDVVFPSDDIAVIAYTVHQKGTMGDKPMDMHCADASTWVKDNGSWKCALHSETMLEDKPKG